ncbi:MAG TPA: DUF6285 domain-containing protein [Burkholderiales bacterium]|nr:DUF6285 domain-containing protein [Burkholderiales bacterium]
MNNLPGATDLLRIARETLLSELRPLVPAHARYTLAMVANAMAISAREIEAGDAPAVAALARFDALYERPARNLAGDALRQALAEADRKLIADIRSGRYDEGRSQHDALIEHLRASVRARLRISNPKSLDT